MNRLAKRFGWLGLVVFAQTHAAVFLVTTTSSSGPGSLQQAVASAITNPGPDTIDCSGVAGTIYDEISMSGEVTLIGPGADLLTISGSNSHRVFSIASGSMVKIAGITIANGYSTGYFHSGAGIRNEGNLTLVGCSVVSNMAVQGIVTYPPSWIGDTGYGGGIFCEAGSVTAISNSTITANEVIGGPGPSDPFTGGGYGGVGIGGGLYLRNATLRIAGSTFAGNVARGGTGGSALHWGGSGGNGYGGGMYLESGVASILNSTFHDDRTVGGSGGWGGTASGSPGGGFASTLYFQSGALLLTNCTLSTTSTFGIGGDLYFYTNGAYLMNCTVVNFITGRSVPIIKNSIVPNAESASFVSDGYNLLTRSSPVPTDVVVTQINMGSLQNNGGPTLTHALRSDSPAIDRGTLSGAPLFDQRGVSRPKRVTVDIGAFELENQPVLRAVRQDGGKALQLALFGEPNARYRLDSSTSFNSWVPFATITNVSGVTEFTNAVPTNPSPVFYRAVLLR